jgi:hypothetical protein
MPTFTVTLAHDVSFYGKKEIEANTWEEAVASLTLADWYDNCTDLGNEGWEQRVLHVDAEDGDNVAEDIAFDCVMVYHMPVVHRLKVILETYSLPDDAITALIDEIRTMGRDPIFNKESKLTDLKRGLDGRFSNIPRDNRTGKRGRRRDRDHQQQAEYWTP